MSRQKQEASLLYDICSKLSKTDHDRLRALAQNQGIKRSQLVREAILTYLQTDTSQTEAAS